MDVTVENEYECVKSAIIVFFQSLLISDLLWRIDLFFWIDAQVLCHEAFIIQKFD